MTLQPALRSCRECGCSFTVTVAEIEHLRTLSERAGGAWALPARCPDCRQAIRDARGDDVITADTPSQWYRLTCEECRREWLFGPRDVSFHAERGFRWPRRCKGCRQSQRRWRESNRLGAGVKR